MVDDKHKRGPADASRINIHEDYEVRYWSEKFNCTKAELVAAIKAVGVIAKTVENHLKQKKS